MRHEKQFLGELCQTCLEHGLHVSHLHAHSLELRVVFNGHPAVLSAKPCGEMGAFMGILGGGQWVLRTRLSEWIWLPWHFILVGVTPR